MFRPSPVPNPSVPLRQSLRARLRHSERLHKEQMELERRQQKAAAEGTVGARGEREGGGGSA